MTQAAGKQTDRLIIGRDPTPCGEMLCRGREQRKNVLKSSVVFPWVHGLSLLSLTVEKKKRVIMIQKETLSMLVSMSVMMKLVTVPGQPSVTVWVIVL